MTSAATEVRLVAMAVKRAARLDDKALIREAQVLTARYAKDKDPLDRVLARVYLDEYDNRG